MFVPANDVLLIMLLPAEGLGRSDHAITVHDTFPLSSQSYILTEQWFVENVRCAMWHTVPVCLTLYMTCNLLM